MGFENTDVKAVGLLRGDLNVPVPYRLIVNDKNETIGVAQESKHLLHSQVVDLVDYAVIESAFKAASRIVGTWENGRMALIEVSFETPASMEHGVHLQYWLINDCVNGDLLVHPGILTQHQLMGTEVTSPVFVLYPTDIAHKITGDGYAHQINDLIAKVEVTWSEWVLPVVVGMQSSAYPVADLIQQVRTKTFVSQKYLDMAEADFTAAEGVTCWRYLVTLSATIDQMTPHNLFRRFDLRRRANKSVRLLAASIDAQQHNHIGGNNEH